MVLVVFSLLWNNFPTSKLIKTIKAWRKVGVTIRLRLPCMGFHAYNSSMRNAIGSSHFTNVFHSMRNLPRLSSPQEVLGQRHWITNFRKEMRRDGRMNYLYGPQASRSYYNRLLRLRLSTLETTKRQYYQVSQKSGTKCDMTNDLEN